MRNCYKTDMKLITFAIPSYNSEKFLASCLDSLLIGVDDKIEAIVINDGSTDRTSEIAHEYAKKYQFIKVVDKENGGHGSGVNVGINIATGLYFKLLDSDDHIDKEGLLSLIETIEKHFNDNTLPDLYFADYISVAEGTEDKITTSHKKWVKRLNIVSDFSNFKKVPEAKYFMVHELVVKTTVLQENNIRLVEKVFYEDTKYVLDCFINSQTFYYLDKPLYLYTVGRIGQSISIEKMDKNYMNMVKVAHETIKTVSTNKIMSMEKYHKRFVMHELNTVFYLLYFYIYLHYRKEKGVHYKEIRKSFKKKEPKLYKQVYYHSLLFWMNIPIPKLRQVLTESAYKIAGKKLGWR